MALQYSIHEFRRSVGSTENDLIETDRLCAFEEVKDAVRVGATRSVKKHLPSQSSQTKPIKPIKPNRCCDELLVTNRRREPNYAL